MAAKVSPETTKVARRRIKPKAQFTEAVLEEMANFGPLLQPDQVTELEKVCQDFGFSRRVTLAILGRSADQLSQACTEDPETFGIMCEQVEGFQAHVKSLAEMGEAARIRLLVCDSREHATGDAA